MVITKLAKIKIQELLQNNNANFLNIELAGNINDGLQTIITFEIVAPKEFITITTSPLVLARPQTYINFANSILDFDEETNELKFQF